MLSGKRIPKSEKPRNQAALARLDIDLDELSCLPNVTDILAKVFNTKQRNPISHIVNYLAASDLPVAREWLKVWRKINVRDRQSLSIEAVSLAAEVSPLEVMGAVLISAKNMKLQESALMAIIAHPDVVKATISSAKNVKMGYNDRKMLHESAVIGFLPTKGGQNIAINLGGKSEDDEEDDDDKAFETAFPTISGKLDKISERRRTLLEGGK